MPASRPVSCLERRSGANAVPARRKLRKPTRAFRQDAQGVTEVLGQILAFAIVTGVFLMSMVAFQKAKESTEDGILQLRSETMATRVASMVVQAGILAEQQGDTVRLRFLVDLPPDLDGVSYRVHLRTPEDQAPSIEVEVPARGITGTASLLAIDAPAGVEVCASTVTGGRLHARYGPSPADPNVLCIYLEATT